MMLKVKMRKEVMMRTTRKTAVRMGEQETGGEVDEAFRAEVQAALGPAVVDMDKEVGTERQFSSKAHFDLGLWSIVAIFAIEIPGMNCL